MNNGELLSLRHVVKTYHPALEIAQFCHCRQCLDGNPDSGLCFWPRLLEGRRGEPPRPSILNMTHMGNQVPKSAKVYIFLGSRYVGGRSFCPSHLTYLLTYLNHNGTDQTWPLELDSPLVKTNAQDFYEIGLVRRWRDRFWRSHRYQNEDFAANLNRRPCRRRKGHFPFGRLLLKTHYSANCC